MADGAPLNRCPHLDVSDIVLSPDFKDDTDMERERRELFVRANVVARGFINCSRKVKLTLFRAKLTETQVDDGFH